MHRQHISYPLWTIYRVESTKNISAYGCIQVTLHRAKDYSPDAKTTEQLVRDEAQILASNHNVFYFQEQKTR